MPAMPANSIHLLRRHKQRASRGNGASNRPRLNFWHPPAKRGSGNLFYMHATALRPAVPSISMHMQTLGF